MICAGDNYFFYFEDIAKKQKRIYPDACDIGYIYPEEEKEKLTTALRELREIYKNTAESWGKPYPNTGGWSCTMFIPFEIDKGMYSGVQLTVEAHRDVGRKINFVRVDIQRKLSKEDGYKN